VEEYMFKTNKNETETRNETLLFVLYYI